MPIEKDHIVKLMTTASASPEASVANTIKKLASAGLITLGPDGKWQTTETGKAVLEKLHAKVQ